VCTGTGTVGGPAGVSYIFTDIVYIYVCVRVCVFGGGYRERHRRWPRRGELHIGFDLRMYVLKRKTRACSWSKVSRPHELTWRRESRF